MPATDFRINVGFFEHPKTLKLQRRLGDGAVLALLRLIRFCTTTRGRSDGGLDGLDNDDIEIAAGWLGEPGILLSTLCELRWIDRRGGALWLHDFEEHNPWAAGADQRSEVARKAAQKRWAKEANKNNDLDAPIIENDAQCNAPSIENDAQGNAPSIENDAQGNALSFFPSFLPSFPSFPSFPNQHTNQPTDRVDLSIDGDLLKETGLQKKNSEGVGAKIQDTKTTTSVAVQTVWGAYREFHPSCAGIIKSTRKEYRLILARMKDGFSVPDLIKAIHGYHRSPFHNGMNDSGKKYLGLELMVRDSPHVEAGIEMADDPDVERRAAMGSKGLKSAYAGESWLAKQLEKENSDARD